MGRTKAAKNDAGLASITMEQRSQPCQQSHVERRSLLMADAPERFNQTYRQHESLSCTTMGFDWRPRMVVRPLQHRQLNRQLFAPVSFVFRPRFWHQFFLLPLIKVFLLDA